MDQSARDRDLMRRCIRNAAAATAHGDMPIGCVIARRADVVAEAGNTMRRTRDLAGHAEMLALKAACAKLKRTTLADCTLYSTVEPCPMCAFAIREAQVGRVVFALGSPVMGGLSKWNVLRDPGLSDVLPEVFGRVPEVVAGLLASEAAEAWHTWNPLVWAAIVHRGCFTVAASDAGTLMPAPPVKHPLLRSLALLRDVF
jgi:tRNA(adenine34) deaminase